MLNKKGFALIETIITMVVLLTTLVLLYSGFSSFYTKEQNYLYYDDIAYIYKTQHIAQLLFTGILSNKYEPIIDENKLRKELKHEDKEDSEDSYILLTGSESDWVTNQGNYTSVLNLYNAYGTIMFIKKDDIPSLKKCLNGDVSDESIDKCTKTQENLAYYNAIGNVYYERFITYLKKLDYDEIQKSDSDAILVVVYQETKKGNEIIENDYATCIETKGKTTMDCEQAVNFAWVYV